MSSIPFHVPNLVKPQDSYNIRPNNSNHPFHHQKYAFSIYQHYSADQFVDHTKFSIKPTPPLALESTPFTFVDTVKKLDYLSTKLNSVDEFAVDLEANMYRSFQGLTCLMQISTRTEDFVVDTLKLHALIGTYLGKYFIDAGKRKIMHGASNDIMWLQRDFGIYVVNLFDTMHGSKVMKLERNSLEHLLSVYCGVKAKKEYQTSDWRVRPLPLEMLQYAREDTHYLLYICDMMMMRLVCQSGVDGGLFEVCQRSFEVCQRLYEKELHKEDSYHNLFGLKEANLSQEQLGAVARLYEWRDMVARKYDESTGYVMPNKLLLEIAKYMPKTEAEFHALVFPSFESHPFVKENFSELFKIVRGSDPEVDMSEIEKLENLQQEAIGKIADHKERTNETNVKSMESYMSEVKTSTSLQQKAFKGHPEYTNQMNVMRMYPYPVRYLIKRRCVPESEEAMKYIGNYNDYINQLNAMNRYGYTIPAHYRTVKCGYVYSM